VRRALAATLLLLCAGGARAQTAPPTALVWIPAESFVRWGRVDDLLRRRADLKLTVALTPEMTTPLVKAVLGPWAALGRVELAARVSGDPILPLVASHPAAPRPDDAAARGADAVREVSRRFGAEAAGLVPGAGAIDAALVGPIAASGAPWVLVGPYAADGAPWAASGRTLFAPARAAPRGAAVAADTVAPGLWAFDETDQPDSPLLAALETLPAGSRPAAGWAAVAGAAPPGPRADAAAVAAWPGWDGAPATAPDPAARAAWTAYGDAAKALAQYQNSGAADLKVLEDANSLLRRAQDARFYRAQDAGAVPSDLRARLLAVYRRLRLAAPESLYASAASTETAEGLPTGVHQAAGPDWAAFDNPSGTLVLSPPGAPSPEPWHLRGLRVEWNDQRVLFRIFVGAIGADAPRPIYDVYIDLNHVLGAGSIRLLEGRGSFAAARDAWEYALSTAGPDARLWRASLDGEPDELSPLEVARDPAHGEVRLTVPRALLRGNPGRWGYIVIALAEDPRRPGRIPSAPLVGADGSVLRGLLSPLEIQKAAFEHPGAPQRVPAVRLDSAP
jgi:hypothetical protein